MWVNPHPLNFVNWGRRGRRGRGGRGRGGGRQLGWNPRNPTPQQSLMEEFIEPNKVYIGNISKSVSDEVLKNFLCQFAPVVDLFVIRKRGHLFIIPFGFVRLANEEDTQKILNLDTVSRILNGSCMDFKPARRQFKLPGTIGFQRVPPADRDYDLEPLDCEQPCIHVLIDDVLLRIFECLPLRSLINTERVCRRWQSLVHTCFRKKACQEINKGDLNIWLMNNKVIPTYHSISKVLILCGEAMTELSVAEVSPCTEGKLLRVIAQLCPALQSLTLSNMSSIYNPFLYEFVNSCRNLKEFQIKKNSSFNESNLQSVITNLPHLEVLHLEGAEIRGKCFVDLPVCLKILNLSQCNLVQPKFIKHICIRCPLLEVLILEGICIPSSLLTTISKTCPSLRELGVEVDGKSCDIEMTLFKNLKKLSYLGFSYSVSKLVNSLPQLEELKLDGLISETMKDPIDFSILTQLRTLILPWNNKVSFSLASLKTITSCTKLEKLKFKGTNDHKVMILELIRKCQFLKELDCPSITLGGEDIEQFVEANKRRQHRLKFVIGLDQSALDQIEKLNDACYDVDMFDVHNLFRDFDVDVDIFDQLGDEMDDYDYYYDSDGSIDSDDANYHFLNSGFYDYDYDYREFFEPLGMFMGDISDEEFYEY